jgi:hypothetical protein
MISIPVVQSEPPIDGVICGSIARSLGRKILAGQLSTRAGAIALVSISVSDCVAKITDAFFLRSVFSHSRSSCAKLVSSSASQPSSMVRRVGRPSSRPSIAGPSRGHCLQRQTPLAAAKRLSGFEQAPRKPGPSINHQPRRHHAAQPAIFGTPNRNRVLSCLSFIRERRASHRVCTRCNRGH